jgi:hypothetical protein
MLKKRKGKTVTAKGVRVSKDKLRVAIKRSKTSKSGAKKAPRPGATQEKTADIPRHILLRVRSEDGLTVRAHRDLITAKGSAVFGKMGKRFSTDVVQAINSQIEGGIKTYLFLTTREGWNGEYVTYKCRLKHIEEKLSASRAKLVPHYYSGAAALINAWFEISTIDRMSRTEMNRIFVISSGREIMSVIASSAVAFHVGWPEPPVSVITGQG